jgi:hypothetical protein
MTALHHAGGALRGLRVRSTGAAEGDDLGGGRHLVYREDIMHNADLMPSAGFML